ncbi:hypothetical protein AC579_2671 [Pseudocercospora musae]|uniref:Uncharacterized protein n=1 Tax=Pseudocercospora musae TaxID=113226 RepID=A0A139IVR1_9PEZI|nr:hypothetical protein AC579_2671 [Pseudocercospora musae]KXT18740.1 hypothetical protein AC579_2671 [Pseudocercospora musae]KXT18741.1 hypothetical protein AC579_2671 [Pseudocercospora musae]KXT18742.1 hypothetical protein AC579_2671 [Pseudocercospora musae]
MKVFGIVSSIVLLLSVGTTAAPNPVCDTGIYKTLVPALAKDTKVQKFCATLPAEDRLDRSKCPNSLRDLAYSVIKTFCTCIKEANQPVCKAPTPTLCGTDPGVCTNLQTDTQNCGTCGKACNSIYTCNSGVCGCPADKPTLCPRQVTVICKFCPVSSTKLCTNTMTDATNCGGCGNLCTGETPNCHGGSCVA